LREWELSFRLGMRPWIAVAYSAPVAAASAVFLVYPIGQGSFSDGMPLGKISAPSSHKTSRENRLKGETLSSVKTNVPSVLTLGTDNWRSKVGGAQICKALPKKTSGNSYNNEPPNDPKDNSLLTPDNIVKGQNFGTLSDLKTSSLPNQPGVYVFRNKTTNTYLVGESKNLKDRIPKHSEQLKNGKANTAFAEAVKKYGLEDFEVILVGYGLEFKERTVRRELENQLLDILLALGLCYNSCVTETHQERPSGLFTNSAGIYKIVNIVDDIVYIGETAQRKGIAQRFRNWKNRLRNNISTNQKLQADWNKLGETAFTFEVIYSGPEWDDDAKRLAEETRLINELRASGKRVYNYSEEEKKAPKSPLAARETILANQSPEYREKMSQQNKDRENLEARKGIVCKENVYLSVAEAADALGYKKNRNPIKNGLKSGKYRLATEQEIADEMKRRENGEGPVRVERKPRTVTGFSEAILVNRPDKNIHNQIFNSYSDAAKALGVSVQAVSKAVQAGRPGFQKYSSPTDSNLDLESPD
jgi:group I intron endonuclease